MQQKNQLKPTESELEILQVLWDKTEATVREVHETLQSVKEVGYTTTLKLMQIMHEKGLVYRNEASRTHIYRAAVERKIMQHQYLQKMMPLFEDSPAQLVMQAIGSNKMSKEEIQQIQDYINSIQ
ncbi:MAG: BlaI/MecI/CopY family transcriptional regulator [Chitinophagaceae bacterium]|nr:MAG: BlaI/MecI/CopY family transcriptional regulator [Chitinophagaceae bacterium]